MTIQKKYFPLFLFFLLSICLRGQERTSVGISPFDYSSRTANPTYVSMIYDHIAFLLAKNPSIKLVDRTNWDKVQEERDLLKTEPFILSETIEQGRSAGAEKLLTGKVYLTDVRHHRDGFAVSFNLYLAVVDLESATVEDNISLSPNGMEDSDKMLQVLRKIRPLAIIPGNRVDKMINIMELFDLAATFQIGGLSQDDSFEEALNQIDQHLIPFIDYHFSDGKGSYQPKGTKKAKIKESKSAGSDEKKERKLPFGIGKDKDQKFVIVDFAGENGLRIRGTKKDGIKKNTRFSLASEELEETTDFNGNVTEGVIRKELAEFKFKEYAGDFAIIEMTNKNNTTLAEVLEQRKDGLDLYIMFKLKGY